MTKILLMNSYGLSSHEIVTGVSYDITGVSYDISTGDFFWMAGSSIPFKTIIILKKTDILLSHNANGFQISLRFWNDVIQSLLRSATEKLLEHYSIDYSHDGRGFFHLSNPTEKTKLIFYLPHFSK